MWWLMKNWCYSEEKISYSNNQLWVNETCNNQNTNQGEQNDWYSKLKSSKIRCSPLILNLKFQENLSQFSHQMISVQIFQALHSNHQVSLLFWLSAIQVLHHSSPNFNAVRTLIHYQSISIKWVILWFLGVHFISYRKDHFLHQTVHEGIKIFPEMTKLFHFPDLDLMDWLNLKAHRLPLRISQASGTWP